MELDLIGVPPTVPLLDDITADDKIVDDPAGAAFGDAERACDVAETSPGVVGDADQCPRMVGEEAPLLHRNENSINLLEK